MKWFKVFLPVILLSVSTQSFSQAAGRDYQAVDEYVKSLGKLDTLNTGTISHLLTKDFPDPKDKTRAIFTWIAENISYDVKAGRSNDNSKSSADLVLKSRKATAAGYAALFQDMCSVAKIRCLTVDGYVKNNVEQINEKPDEFNHTWAVVQLGQSPDTWHYVDVTCGSGYTDDKMTTFTKAYNENYFFADKPIFNTHHFPDNTAWYLGQGSKNLGDFLEMPIVKPAAFEFGVSKTVPKSGYIKASPKKAVVFSFAVKPKTDIEIISLAMGPDKKKQVKTVDYTISKGIVSFGYKFEEEDSFPVSILINNKPVLGYYVEVTE